MSENTKIEWATHTFNGWEGCQKAGPGCDNCYAETRNKRFGGGVAVNWGPGAPRRRTSAANWRKPLAWNANHETFFAAHGYRQRVFCASLADVFDNAVDPQWRVDLFDLIARTPNLDWLLLTKRIGNAWPMMQEVTKSCGGGSKPLPNVWIGATIVNQEEADRDIPKLLAVPAAKRFLSMEPLLGPVDLGRWIGDEDCHACGARFFDDEIRLGWHNSDPVVAVDFEDEPEDERDIRRICPHCGQRDNCGEVGQVDEEDFGGGLHWVIVGGESGPGARPMHPDWARSLRDQCQAAGVPFLFKQWGEWKPISQMSEPEHSGLYKSRVTAKPHEDQVNLDDINGRRCTAPTSVLHIDGSVHGIVEPMAFLQGTVAMQIFNVGKKAAGRLLDGRTWDGVPA